MVAAVARNGVIGSNGRLPWHIPADLKRFKRLTWGHTVVMGRKTFESLGCKPLPGRRNVVISHKPRNFSDTTFVPSVQEALRCAGNTGKVFVIGGGEVYRLFLPLAHRLEITHIQLQAEGDVHFPKGWSDHFKLLSEVFYPAEPSAQRPPFSFATYERI
ncbi:MAG: dihydrofolate reductase [Flavobacteriales bacterium]|nr:dihydrofolate reductase [Flavobacteriales bacterium]